MWPELQAQPHSAWTLQALGGGGGGWWDGGARPGKNGGFCRRQGWAGREEGVTRGGEVFVEVGGEQTEPEIIAFISTRGGGSESVFLPPPTPPKLVWEGRECRAPPLPPRMIIIIIMIMIMIMIIIRKEENNAPG